MKLNSTEKKELHNISIRWQQLYMEKLQLIEMWEHAIQELHRIQQMIMEHSNELVRLDAIRQGTFVEIQNKMKGK